MESRWKWIEGFEDLYDIDKRGNIRRHYANGNISLLNIHDTNGTDTVRLSMNSVLYSKSVDKLLFETHGISYSVCVSRLFNEPKKKGAWTELKETELYKQLKEF